jgi:hypothetical protein
MLHNEQPEVRLEQLVRRSREVTGTDHHTIKNAIPAELMWRFFIPTHAQQHNTGWIQQEQRQPGFMETLPHAFHCIFRKSPLTVDLILNMHKTVTPTLTNPLPSPPGELRSNLLGGTVLRHQVTQSGMRELFTEFTPDIAFSVNSMLIHKLSLIKLLKGRHVPHSKEFSRDFPDLFNALLAATASRQSMADVMYKMTQTDGITVIHCSIESNNTQQELRDYAQNYVDIFNHDMRDKDISALYKIGRIIKFIQELTRLHLFEQYAMPTLGIILFQHLLVSHLSIVSMLDDPDIFYGHSADEILNATFKGIEHVIEVIEKREQYSAEATELLISLEAPNALGITRDVFDRMLKKEHAIRCLSETSERMHHITVSNTSPRITKQSLFKTNKALNENNHANSKGKEEEETELERSPSPYF